MDNTKESSERSIDIAGVMFSEEEVKMLYLLSEGKTYKEIAVLIDQVSGKNGISYVKNRLSSKTHSASLLKRVGVESSNALVTWYIENTQPERITEVVVYQDPPWHRSDTALRMGLTLFYFAVVLVFLNYWGLPEKGLSAYLSVNIYCFLPLFALLFQSARWWQPLKTKGAGYSRQLLPSPYFLRALDTYCLAQLCWIAYYFLPGLNLLIALMYVTYFSIYFSFINGFLRIYKLHSPLELVVPKVSRAIGYVTLSLTAFIGTSLLLSTRGGWSTSLANDPVLILQILCILTGSMGLGIALHHVSYIIRFDHWPERRETRKVLWATIALVIGFILFFIANLGFIITASTTTQSLIASNRGGWIDFLYATACYIIGFGTLIIPTDVEQALIQKRSNL